MWFAIYLVLGAIISRWLERHEPELFLAKSGKSIATTQVVGIILLWPAVLAIIAFVQVIGWLFPNPPQHSWHVNAPNPAAKAPPKAPDAVELKLADPQPARLGGDHMGVK